MKGHFKWFIMTFLNKFGLSLNVNNISWAISMRCCFCAQFSARLMPKTVVKIAWHEPNDMPASSVSSLTVTRRLSKIISFTDSVFLSFVNVLGRPGQASPLTSSRPSLIQLYHNWICVLLTKLITPRTWSVGGLFHTLKEEL